MIHCLHNYCSRLVSFYQILLRNTFVFFKAIYHHNHFSLINALCCSHQMQTTKKIAVNSLDTDTNTGGVKIYLLIYFFFTTRIFHSSFVHFKIKFIFRRRLEECVVMFGRGTRTMPRLIENWLGSVRSGWQTMTIGGLIGWAAADSTVLADDNVCVTYERVCCVVLREGVSRGVALVQWNHTGVVMHMSYVDGGSLWGLCIAWRSYTNRLRWFGMGGGESTNL